MLKNGKFSVRSDHCTIFLWFLSSSSTDISLSLEQRELQSSANNANCKTTMRRFHNCSRAKRVHCCSSFFFFFFRSRKRNLAALNYVNIFSSSWIVAHSECVEASPHVSGTVKQFIISSGEHNCKLFFFFFRNFQPSTRENFSSLVDSRAHCNCNLRFRTESECNAAWRERERKGLSMMKSAFNTLRSQEKKMLRKRVHAA